MGNVNSKNIEKARQLARERAAAGISNQNEIQKIQKAREATNKERPDPVIAAKVVGAILGAAGGITGGIGGITEGAKKGMQYADKAINAITYPFMTPSEREAAARRLQQQTDKGNEIINQGAEFGKKAIPIYNSTSEFSENVNNYYKQQTDNTKRLLGGSNVPQIAY
jgi:hypothetical protein